MGVVRYADLYVTVTFELSPIRCTSWVCIMHGCGGWVGVAVYVCVVVCVVGGCGSVCRCMCVWSVLCVFCVSGCTCHDCVCVCACVAFALCVGVVRMLYCVMVPVYTTHGFAHVQCWVQNVWCVCVHVRCAWAL